MKFGMETEAKLSKLSPRERTGVLEVAKRPVKAKLRKMLDRLAARDVQRSASLRISRKNSAGETLH